jgi:pimeloyl-ACP methyl ester carboxylesterase
MLNLQWFNVDHRRTNMSSMRMSPPTLHHVQCLSPQGLHRMAYWQWGDPTNDRVLVCVHGLSRQGRDFDVFAQVMQPEYRVICPDVVGRGQSDWLRDPAGYQLPNYVADMVTLLARVNAKTVHWVGTSMGGLIGMGLASLPQSPIQRLVVNDVGPSLEFSALQRIGNYLGLPMHWASVEDAAAYLATISVGFGPHTPAQWMALCQHMVKPVTVDGNNVYKLHYDPQIAAPFRAVTPEAAAAGQAMLWMGYDAITCPTLLLRGMQSDLLSPATAQAMTQRGPKARLVEFEGVGHAPMLVQADQVAVVREFLLSA